jgi:hypothetical protein
MQQQKIACKILSRLAILQEDIYRENNSIILRREDKIVSIEYNEAIA